VGDLPTRAGNELLADALILSQVMHPMPLPGIITGSMSAQEAMQHRQTILNSLINGFVQMGVEWVKSASHGAGRCRCITGIHYGSGNCCRFCMGSGCNERLNCNLG
jgi:hypothetical protein